MITIIITSYKEPKATIRAIKSFLNQEIPGKFKIIVVDPFPDILKKIKKEVKSKKVEFFLDPGEGKSYALNILLGENFSNNSNDILIFTDGDVYVSENAVSEILKCFQDKKIGCATGRPVPIDSRDNKYGYWSYVLLSGIHKVRKKLSLQKSFFECSGYLFAIRNSVITGFPLETSEDSIIPYLFWKKGYKICYAEKAEVYVKNPSTWKDWVNQKIRNIKAHENLNEIASGIRRTKSFFNEIKEGAFYVILQPRNLKEFLWTIELYFARLYVYLKAFAELRNKKSYSDGWRETEMKSTRTLD